MQTIEVPLVFRHHPEWASVGSITSNYLPQTYSALNGQRTQPILQGRTILRPAIDLNRFRCVAIIDWLELYLQTEANHQATNIQKWLANQMRACGSRSSVFVSGPNSEHRHIGNFFRVRLQQPDPADLAAVLLRLQTQFGSQPFTLTEYRIAGIEVSVDFFPKTHFGDDQRASDLMRWHMVDTLRRHLRPHPALTEATLCQPRSYGGKYGGGGATYFVAQKLSAAAKTLTREARRLEIDPGMLAPLSLQSHHQPPVDLTSYIGAKDHVVALRIMDKVTDRRDPNRNKVDALDSKHWRARIEVTLTGHHREDGGHGAAGLRTTGDLFEFNFQSLRPSMFEFFLPTTEVPGGTGSLGFRHSVDEVSIFARSGVYGLDRFHRAIEVVEQKRFAKGELAGRPTRLGKKGRLVSWTEMNQKVDRALHGLSKDWRSAR
ncbi:hypothetical protein FGK63_08680 [Ruegeria sediminis]|uniref:Uncharacterized protein n=1 Tax=Ruegeria sediminis TaxID=2583820 RepID=A0ABY2WYA6_9RHOB|nr:hypothetical protein [Ruegeria sediminis]TMV07537.1 hypothetical protein FGK63_08680 [Ruegeria sediminis]